MLCEERFSFLAVLVCADGKLRLRKIAGGDFRECGALACRASPGGGAASHLLHLLKKDKNIQEIPVNKLTFLLLVW